MPRFDAPKSWRAPAILLVAVASGVLVPPASTGVWLKRPVVVESPIPFGAARRVQTAAYSKRHYGVSTWRLEHPRVIVQHYTASTTFGSVFATFSSNAADQEYGEKPGVCSHYVINVDGTIHQLVRDTIMCRHTVGLNWTAIGIEHVGTSDAATLGNPRQLRASLRLTLWLMERHAIALRDVIGHSESLNNPYYREKVPTFRCRTHSDWSRQSMVTYRTRLRALAAETGTATGPRAYPSQPRRC